MDRFVLQVYREVAGATFCWDAVAWEGASCQNLEVVLAGASCQNLEVVLAGALEGLPESLVDLVEALVDLEEVLLAIAVLQVLQVPEAVGKNSADSMMVERLALKKAYERLRIVAALMASAILQRREPT